MDNLETTLRNNRDWALTRIHRMCDTDAPYNFMDAAAIVSEFEEWFDTKNEECDILSFEYEEM